MKSSEIRARRPTLLTRTIAQRCRSATETHILEDLFNSIVTVKKKRKKIPPLET